MAREAILTDLRIFAPALESTHRQTPQLLARHARKPRNRSAPFKRGVCLLLPFHPAARRAVAQMAAAAPGSRGREAATRPAAPAVPAPRPELGNTPFDDMEVEQEGDEEAMAPHLAPGSQAHTARVRRRRRRALKRALLPAALATSGVAMLAVGAATSAVAVLVFGLVLLLPAGWGGLRAWRTWATAHLPSAAEEMDEDEEADEAAGAAAARYDVDERAQGGGQASSQR